MLVIGTWSRAVQRTPEATTSLCHTLFNGKAPPKLNQHYPRLGRTKVNVHLCIRRGVQGDADGRVRYIFRGGFAVGVV